MTSKTKRDPYYSRAVAKAFEALELIGKKGPMTLGELSAELHLGKPSAMRLAHTLEGLGHASRDESGRYQARERRAADLVAAGSPVLQRLNEQFQETVSMAALFGNRSEVILVFESPHLVRMGNVVGRILPPHASSLGKAITAFQDDDVRARLLRSYGTTPVTARTLTGEEDLRKNYAVIRKNGYAEDREESAAGGVCFAAPIIGDGDWAIGAISMSIPKMRLGDEKRVIAAVRRAARTIGNNLGVALAGPLR